MPPSGARRPERAASDAFVHSIEDKLDRAEAARPNPGATALHRLNRFFSAALNADASGLTVGMADLDGGAGSDTLKGGANADLTPTRLARA